MTVSIYDTLEALDPSSYVGVDAVTYTTTTEEGFLAIRAMLEELLRDCDNEKRTPFFIQGASGYKVGSVRYAERLSRFQKREWAIVMVTGPTAQAAIRYAHLGLKTTRVDLRVDVELKAQCTDLAQRYYRVMSPLTKDAKFVASPSGETFYPTQKRDGTYFARLYDKSSTYNKELGWVWRYEAELKKEAAKQVVDILLECYDVATFIQETVFGTFAERWGVPVPKKGILPKVNYAGLSASTIDGRIDWIRRNVAPSVQRLIKAGLEDTVVDCLGIEAIVERRVNEALQTSFTAGWGI